MKFVIALIIIVGFFLGARLLYNYWETVKAPEAAAAPAPVEVSGDQLPGLPPALEGLLRTAEEHGVEALRQFLADHGNVIKDPRRASIELDYVVLAGANDPGEARRVFAKVKARLMPDSPVYERMKRLESAYE